MADTRSPFDEIRSIRIRFVKPRWLMVLLAAAMAVMGAGTWAQHARQTEAPRDAAGQLRPDLVENHVVMLRLFGHGTPS